MNAKQELSPELDHPCASPNGSGISTEQPTETACEIQPTIPAQVAPAQPPSLLDGFCSWVLSRS